MQVLPVVDLLEEVSDGRSRRGDVAMVASVDLLLLMGFHEAFRCGVVVGLPIRLMLHWMRCAASLAV